jgi:dihydrofolate reductase
MIISLIAAMTPDRVIGKNNQLPWQMPADLQHFKKITLHKTIVMGRKTYQSIGRPLPHRRNIVITRDRHFMAPGCEIFHSLALALEALEAEAEIFIIGGGELYTQTIDHANYLYLTFIHAPIQGDSFFPEWDSNDWVEILRELHLADEENPYDYTFSLLEKRQTNIMAES